MSNKLRIGILGGGQLGRMLLQTAANYPVETFVMDSDPNCPASLLCDHFIQGDIMDYDAVLNFADKVDVLTIETENVNLNAIHSLSQQGLKVYPNGAGLETFQSKYLNKSLCDENNIPTAKPFYAIKQKQELHQYASQFPMVLKQDTGGYDGKGVMILRTADDIANAFDSFYLLEPMVDIAKEIAVIVAKNDNGEVAVYPPTEMVFDPKYHLLDYLLSPADITPAQAKEAQRIAIANVNIPNSPGIFAVELFLDKQGNILLNETAPRAHNSGHQTIEGNYCSQFDMQMRILQNLPLGNTEITQPSLLINLIGEEGYTGSPIYQGIETILKMKAVYLHLYGKTTTKPGRKMGHITILGSNKQELLEKAAVVKKELRVIA